MRIHLSCLIVAVAVLSLGTMANATLLNTPSISRSGTVCTVTETLYYAGYNSGTDGVTSGGGNGVGTNQQNYTAPAPGTSGSGAGGSSGLIATNWTASYAFDTFSAIATADNITYNMASAAVKVVDSTVGTISMSQSNQSGPGWYGYAVTTTADFSTNSTPTNGNSFITDVDSDVNSGYNPFYGEPNGNTSGNAGACSMDGGTNNGNFDYVNGLNPKEQDTCVYLTENGPSVSVSGYDNTAQNYTSSGAGDFYLPTSEFLTGSSLTLYETVASSGGANGASENSSASAGAGTEIQLVYTYDLPSTGPTGTPEPATLLLLGTGLSFVASRLRRVKNGAAK